MKDYINYSIQGVESKHFEIAHSLLKFVQKQQFDESSIEIESDLNDTLR